MDLTGRAHLRHPPEPVRAWVEDLATYPSWLSIVASATPDPGHHGDPGPAWLVDLGTRLGPLRRTKRVRMVRTVEPSGAIRYERREIDGAPHGEWILDAAVAPAPGAGTDLTVRLRYRGQSWLRLLEPVLREEMRRAGSRLDSALDRTV